MASIEGARPYIEPVAAGPTAAAAAAAGASMPPAASEAVISVEPTARELTPVELLQQSRGYLAMILLLAAAAILAKIGLVLWRRYRRDNVSPISSLAADRHSLRQQQQGKQKKKILL
jgi:hypothetical protein